MSGGVNGAGTIFELQKIGASYATTPTVLTSFGAGVTPSGATALIQDASGNLFGSTSSSVFEVKKTGSTYSAPSFLVPFPVGTQIGGLTIDAHGNIFGTTVEGGASDAGSVFEIEKTATGYASTPTPLASFTAADGQLTFNRPKTMIVDANGDLFGTTDPSSQNPGGSCSKSSGHRPATKARRALSPIFTGAPNGSSNWAPTWSRTRAGIFS